MNCVTIDRGIRFHSRRFFTSSTGVALPLRLISELEPSAIAHRNIYFVAYYDTDQRLVGFDKRVYGDCVLSHRYEYYDQGVLKRAIVHADGEEQGVLLYDTGGRLLSSKSLARETTQ